MTIELPSFAYTSGVPQDDMPSPRTCPVTCQADATILFNYLNSFVGNRTSFGSVPEMSFRLKVIITSAFIQKEFYFLLAVLS